VSFIRLELECQRVGCDAEQEIELDDGHIRHTLERIMAEGAPGWGWDLSMPSGVDLVLHCPVHRT
jgi:hypothetical protein